MSMLQRTSVQLRRDQVARLEQLAREEDRKVSYLVRAAIDHYLTNRGDEITGDSVTTNREGNGVAA